MFVRLPVIALAIGLLIPDAASAAASACPTHFHQGQAPELRNVKLDVRVRELCYTGFALLHSGISRTALWAAEYLSRERVDAARGIERVNAFHPEGRLPVQERAELIDYRHSRMDRGHMVPSGDAGDPLSQEETFTLANMVPQHPESNRTLWSDLEGAVRALARTRGQLYVVTGPLFLEAKVRQLNGRVMVPTALFKAVYDPAGGRAAAYVAPNAPGSDYKVVSLVELEQLSGIDVFPNLSPEAKATAMILPEPKRRRPRGEGEYVAR